MAGREYLEEELDLINYSKSSNLDKVHEDMKDEMYLLKQKMHKMNEEMAQMKEKLSVVKGLCEEKEVKCGEMKSKLEELMIEKKKLEEERKYKNDECNNLSVLVEETNKELKGLKSRKAWKALNRKQQSISVREKHILKHHHQKTIKSRKNSNDQVTKLEREKEMMENELAVLKDRVVEGGVKEMKDGKRYKDCVEINVMRLCGEQGVATQKVGEVMAGVAEDVFGVKLDSVPCASTANNIIDRGFVLCQYQLKEAMKECESWDLHGDGTSRGGKKFWGKQINFDNDTMLSGGFSAIASDDSSTLLECVMEFLDDLSYLENEDERENLKKVMLSKLRATMNNRASVNKKFNTLLSEYRSDVCGETVDALKYLFCNAHFLLGLSNKSDSLLKDFEKGLVRALEVGLGRDAFGKFGRFQSGGESATSRVIRTGCDILGPRGDEKNGVRQEWVGYCFKRGIKSVVSSFRMNRFNNFFEGAGTIYFHRDDIIDFLSNFKEKLNLKVESVLHDCLSSEIMSLLGALGLIYFSVTGPFWLLLCGTTQYLDFFKYVQPMLDKFKVWCDDSISLIISAISIFDDFKMNVEDEVWMKLRESDSNDEMTENALRVLMKGFVEVTERQLNDFVEGGEFSVEPSTELREKMKSCKLTNLVSEFEFGDLDFSLFKRRNASLFFHTNIQMLKKNRTISKWLKSKPPKEQVSYLQLCRGNVEIMKERQKMREGEVLKRVKEKLEETNKTKHEGEMKKQESDGAIIERVLRMKLDI
ncbi:uncharacterized protein LOC117122178 [Anneissia japonica]|uniref:uncharacterized protein LOC117122178 n=1 Tax=Anneissia japonica TaxID=1529436 RepID=UPI0014258B93|nr:uncharacterized protein LOC117122178 [Anneissia japonica]